MNPPAEHAGPQRVPALDIAAVVQRHAGGFERVRACGDWSERRFRQFAGPVLLAFARHAHLLPSSHGEASGSLLDAGLDACAQAVLAEGACDPRALRIERQEAVVLRVLSHWTVAAVRQWRVSTMQGRPIVLAARPLADQLHDPVPGDRRFATAPDYLIEAVVGADCTSGAGKPIDAAGAAGCAFGMVLLLRAVPSAALATACVPSPLLIVSLIEHALGQLPPSPLPLTQGMQVLASGVPVPLSPERLRNVMQALIAEGRWQANVRRARLWNLDGRLYLAWKTAATELAGRLSHDPADVLAALVACGIVLPGCSDDAFANPAGVLRAIRTPYTESLPVVELADADAWLRVVATAPGVSCASVPAPEEIAVARHRT
ncbi:MAG: hypothetical protein LW923_08875 [Betaproteobacteria bacterium]|nr:hypothetical protein [Betaproteobacteria bacterium]